MRRKLSINSVDPWYGKWLKVGRSGAEWRVHPPAHGNRLSTTDLLRWQLPPFDRREESAHHSVALAPRRGGGIHPSSRAARRISARHVAGGVRENECRRGEESH